MRLQGRGMMHYRDFNNMTPPEFDGFKDPIIAMRWISDVEGCLFTCLCPENMKFKYALNLLGLGMKDWWKMVTSSYSPKKIAVVTWEECIDIFRTQYVLLVERDMLAQEYLSLKQTTNSMVYIIKMFIERPLFCPEYSALEQVHMYNYLSMCGTEIKEFFSTHQNHSFFKP